MFSVGRKSPQFFENGKSIQSQCDLGGVTHCPDSPTGNSSQTGLRFDNWLYVCGFRNLDKSLANQFSFSGCTIHRNSKGMSGFE
jgi:hypothetical protein